MSDVHQTLYQRRGAVTFVAAKLGISIPAVSQWRKRGIPDDRLEAVQAALAEMDGGPVASNAAAAQ
jgi:hypothetical protein